MLIDEPVIMAPDPIGDLIASVNGNNPQPRRASALPGIYFIGHFGSSAFLEDQHYTQYALQLCVNAYGVCDSAEQLLEKCPALEGDPQRKFVVTFTPIVRANQDPSCGWRWHKWGPYIGTQEREHEYLYDEKDIDEVLVYHIYEKLPDHVPLTPWRDGWDEYWKTVKECHDDDDT
jgi:hypothetical protein